MSMNIGVIATKSEIANMILGGVGRKDSDGNWMLFPFEFKDANELEEIIEGAAREIRIMQNNPKVLFIMINKHILHALVSSDRFKKIIGVKHPLIIEIPIPLDCE